MLAVFLATIIIPVVILVIVVIFIVVVILFPLFLFGFPLFLLRFPLGFSALFLGLSLCLPAFFFRSPLRFVTVAITSHAFFAFTLHLLG